VGAAPLVILGATGSIGGQALEVAERLGIEVAVVAARAGSDRLAAIGERHPEASVVVAAPTGQEQERFRAAFGERARFGREAVEEAASAPGRTVLNGMVGAAGLRATLAALGGGNRLALANKESLVAGGSLVTRALQAGGGELIPVDSEHSAILQCLVGEPPDSVRRILLTASGGPFRGLSLAGLEAVTPDEALRHPTWSMGPRITVDSATLLNKGLEVIEAHVLFGIGYERIEVLIHPQSVVHSLVEFEDGSVKAQLGEPDMRLPIQYALTYPERRPAPASWLQLAGSSLAFEEPDLDSFPALALAFEAGRRGGSAPAVLNAADEVAVRAFLERRIGFTSIPRVLQRALERVPWREPGDIDEVIEVDREARAAALEAVTTC
jgi:1-deoxy-D-xylulose-5-phosphate reductoisomerase